MNPETCEKGQEQYEEYYSEMAHKYLIHTLYITTYRHFVKHFSQLFCTHVKIYLHTF